MTASGIKNMDKLDFDKLKDDPDFLNLLATQAKIEAQKALSKGLIKVSFMEF